MADFEAPRLLRITPDRLRIEILNQDEIAIADVREGDCYAAGHISVAVELSLSEIELRVGLLLPRKTVRIIVTDDAHAGASAFASSDR